MSIPSLLISPHESRSRTALVTPTVSSANVDVLPDSWRLWRGIGDASLLLSPEESRHTSGPVEPTIHDGSTIGSGQYGQTWEMPDATGGVSVLGGNLRDAAEGMGVLRLRIDEPLQSSPTPYLINVGGLTGSSTSAYYALWSNGGDWRGRDNTTSSISETREDVSATPGYRVAALGWDAASLSYDFGQGSGLQTVERAEHDGTWVQDRLYLGRWQAGGEITGAIESYVEYPHVLSAEEYERISQMPRRWEWGPDGTVSAPLATPPVSVMVRTPDGVEHVVMEDGAGAFNGNGTLTYDDDTLTVGTTDETEVTALLAYNDTLSDTTVQRLSSMETWTWDAVLPHAGGVRRVVPDEPVGVRRVVPDEPVGVRRTHGEEN